MTQPGYYDYAPTVALGRPVAITGHPGAPFREIAYELAALTGLPIHDLDRRIEHDVGQSLWALARQQGLETLHQHEARALPLLLGDGPPGLLVLGEGALLDPDNLARLRGAAGLVFCRLPAVHCYWALRQRADARDGVLGHPWLPDRLADPEDLRPLLGLQQPVVDAADEVIDMDSTTVRAAVTRLQASLPALARHGHGDA